MGLDSDSPAPSNWPPHSGRKGSKKVRTGCITCKIRKVKCDEAKPYCMRCTKTGRRCDGYLDAKTMAQRRRRSAGPTASSAGAELHAPVSLFYDWASSDERRAFHFFQHITAPCLSGDHDAAFWRVLVLQICQAEPAVRHAVLAVSSLHEGMVQATSMTPFLGAEDRSSFALYQYNQAIACLLNQMRTVETRPLIPLLTCVLFVCIELMQSKDKESLLHLEQGRQILNQLGRRSSMNCPEVDLIKQHLVPMYTRLSLTSLMLGGEPVEIPLPLKTMIEVPMVFETIDEVRYALYDFMDECLRFSKKTHAAKIEDVLADEMRAFEDEQACLLKKLAKFKVAFSLYHSTKCRNAPSGSLALIQIHAHTTFIWVSTALSRHEAVFDDYVDTFAAIIPLALEFVNSLATTPTREQQHAANRPAADTRRFTATFTFDMHIIAPLYFVAAKCRHPVIRRTALDLLRRNPARRENLWRANVMAAIAERTMRLEEKHLRDAHSQPQSRHPSPPDLPMLFPGPSTAHESDPWMTSSSDAAFSDTFGSITLGSIGGPGSRRQPPDGFDTTQPPVTSSGSVSSTTGSIDVASISDLASQLPIDPTLFFDPPEGSTAHSFSAAPSIASSLDDLGATSAAAVSTPYVGSTSSAADLWSGGTTSSSHAPPGIALEPPTPMDDPTTIFAAMPLPSHHSSHPHSRSHSRSHSRHPSLSRGPPSVEGSDGSPVLHAMGMDLDMELDLDLVGQQQQQQQQQRHHHQHHQQQQQQRPVLNIPGTGGAFPHQQQQPYGSSGVPAGQQMSLGQLSPTTGKRSAEAPFDVPERFRVHESIIGPEKEDGTSWVMLFRKLEGLDADWDVMTEYLAVA